MWKNQHVPSFKLKGEVLVQGIYSAGPHQTAVTHPALNIPI